MRRSLVEFVFRIIKHLPVILLAAFIVVYAILFIFKQESLMIRGSFLLLPMIILVFLYFKRFKREKQGIDLTDCIIDLKPGNFHRLTLVFFLLQITSIAFMLIQNGRTLPYFVLIGLSIIPIALQICSINKDTRRPKSLILFEIVLLYLNIVLTQTLFFPLYFGTTDPMFHMSYIDSVIQNDKVTSALGTYETAPLFHVWGAMGILITGLDLQTGYFLIFTMAFSVTIPLIYIFTRKITHNSHIALIASLVYAISSETIFAGMGVTTRVFCFILVLMMLWLNLERENNKKFFIAIFLIIPLIITHQTTLIHLLGILVVLLITEIILVGKNNIISIKFVGLYFVCFLSYWMFGAHFIFEQLVKTLITTSEMATMPDISAIAKPLSTSLFGSLDQAMYFLFSLFGIITSVVIFSDDKKRSSLIVMMIFGFIALLLYIDSPLQYFAYLLLTSRLPLLVSPFVFLPIAYGIYYLTSKRVMNVIVLSAVAIFIVINSLLTLGNATDLNLSRVLGNENRRYFTVSEVSCFNFLIISQENNDKSIPLFTDWQASRYFHARSNLQASSLISWPEVAKTDYYNLVRTEEINNKQMLKFTKLQPNSSRAISVVISRDEINKWVTGISENKIYQSNTINVHYVVKK